jgi:hypothetical protein
MSRSAHMSSTTQNNSRAPKSGIGEINDQNNTDIMTWINAATLNDEVHLHRPVIFDYHLPPITTVASTTTGAVTVATGVETKPNPISSPDHVLSTTTLIPVPLPSSTTTPSTSFVPAISSPLVINGAAGQQYGTM